jgi:HPt (histidine-containing phosphotransfer) domain-containing protein
MDIDDALKKWHSEASYQKPLWLFLTQHADDAQLLSDALARQDNSAAHHITHKLLGVAGALSLPRLVYLIKLMSATPEQTLSAELVARFERSFAQTLTAIENYLPVEPEPNLSSGDIALNPAIKKDLKQLINMIDSNNPELIEYTLNAMTGKCAEQYLNRIRAAVDNFDFNDAKIIANELLAELLRHEEE